MAVTEGLLQSISPKGEEEDPSLPSHSLSESEGIEDGMNFIPFCN